ncbi:MAG: PAS domain S-box protein [Deltaproteobacteria bacterium]|nr:PAS domain S-box protein [Deltaproteobacteria bacterium]
MYEPLSPQVRQLRTLVVARLLVVTAIVAPAFFYTGTPEEKGLLAVLYQGASPAWVRILLFATIAASFVYALMLKIQRLSPQLQAWIQLSGDLVLVSALVFIFGGILSPFSMFYPVIIVLASFYLGRPAAATAFASAALVLYTSLMLGLFFGWQGFGTIRNIDPDITIRLTYNVVVALVGFYAVALLGSTLARRTQLVQEKLEKETERLESLKVVYQDVIQSIVSGLVTTDHSGMISSVNRAGEIILSQSSGELVGHPITDSAMFSTELWRRSQADCEKIGRAFDEVDIVRGPNQVTVGFSMTRLKDASDNSRGYIVIFQDLTEKRKMQEELRVKDRMAAVGELAAGIAHEIGNPLAAISGSAQMLARSLPQDQSGVRLLEIILKESQRLDRTIKGFLRFARPKDSALIRFDISQLLREHFSLLTNSAEVSSHHELSIDIPDNPIMMLGDADQISQIFWNLARNALRAMPSGGTLRLSGRQIEDSYQFVVEDTGKGMTEDERAKMFQPFQSFFDRGTGIGMSIVYRIIQEHDGRLRVESEPGKGTQITVDLPLMPSLEQQTLEPLQ